MSKQFPAFRALSLALLLMIVIQACMRARLEAPSNSAPSAEQKSEIQTTREPSRTPSPEKISTSTATESIPTATALPKVTITAVKGNLFIRRGPGMAYNPISVLRQGETALATARDVLSDWVQVVIPSQPEHTGWVSLQTNYSRVDGNVNDLPAIQVTYWPTASYLRNCTHHSMIAQPGDIVIPSLLAYPENEVWVYPGTYTLYDLDVDEYPEVMTVQLSEGIEIDIHVDGDGEKRKCPE